MAFRKILGYKAYSRMGAGTPPVPPYTPVKWVKGTGASIDTGIKPTINTEVYFELFIPSRNSGKYMSYEFGSENPNYSPSEIRSFSFQYFTEANSTGFIDTDFIYYYGNKGKVGVSKPNGGQINTFKFNKDGFWLNGNFIVAPEPIPVEDPVPENLNIYLMGCNGSQINYTDGYYGWVSAYIKDEDVLLRDFKAAKDNDGKYCFYDLVSKQFFYPISGNLTGEDLP